MKAMLLKGPGTPLVLETVPDPVPGPGEAVAKVLACGAGLTIHHARAGRLKVDYPRILGHEITAEIVAVGTGVKHLQPGDGVTAYFYITCGACHWCNIDRETLCDHFGGYVGREVDGGYAEYIKLPARQFLRIPDGLDWRSYPAEVAVVCDAIATPVKVIQRARLTPRDTVAVFGAGGGLGIQMLKVARWAHAKRVIAVDVAPGKLPLCREAGADAVIDASQGKVAEQLLELTDGRGIDLAIDFVSGKDTLEAGFNALAKAGRLVTLGGNGRAFSLDPAAMLRKEAEVFGSRYATRQEVLDSLDLVARGELWPVVSDKVPLEQAEVVHQRLEDGLVAGRAVLMVG